MSGYFKCSVTLPRGAEDWSALCDCGISWSYPLTFWRNVIPNVWINSLGHVSLPLGVQRIFFVLNKLLFWRFVFGPHREKTCLRGFRQSEFQTGLLSNRD